MAPVHLRAGAYALDLEPEEGGAVARFDWNGLAMFRPRTGVGPLNSACFPLVPFSNRIACGRFTAHGRTIRLKPNFPGARHRHPLHGSGWLRAWRTQWRTARCARLAFVHEPSAWPWRFCAQQQFRLSPAGLMWSMHVRNLDKTAMPVGLGLHPYFPWTPQARYEGLHCGEWKTSPEGLPLRLELKDQAIDWWRGRPISSRSVDTVYVGRRDALSIEWPETDVRLEMRPSRVLAFTTVYAPKGGGFFCVEPVSHITNAVNRRASANGLRWLAPSATITASVHFRAKQIGAGRTRAEVKHSIGKNQKGE